MKRQNFTNLFNNVLRRGSGVNRYLFRYAAMVVVLCVLGVGEMWADSYYNYFAYYAKVNAKTATESSGRGMVYVSTSSASTSSATSESSTATGQDPTTNYSSAPTSGGAVTFYLYAKPKDGYKFDGWSTSSTRPSIFESTSASWQTTFPAGYGTSTSTSGSSSQTNNYKSDGSGSDQYYSVTATHNVYAYFSERIMVFDVSFAQPSNGTITVNGVAPSSWPYAAHTTTGSLSCTMTATPSAGYIFYGYYVLNSDNSKNYLSRTASTTLTLEEAKTVYAEFIPDTWAIFQLGADTYYDLNLANAKAVAAGGGTIVQIKDGTMPAGNYTISNNVKLLIPFSTATSIQTLPKVVTTAATLSVYRKLVLAEGINITVASGGVICVGGQIMSAGGGKPSAYPTGACGMIDMSAGGHIELNNGAVLYAWGFIKGQDKDQGNNTTGVGTITANSGATVWEMFAVGDWRGGTACSTIYNNRNSWKFFPFQSYTIQNVEVPTTYKYGSTLSNYTNVYGGGGTNPGQFAIIGNTNTLFLLKDAASLVRKWYDPTTDLVCYEMSGTTQLDALNVDVEIITVSSKDYNLPLSSSMHVILTNCNTTISRPMIVQAGAVVEVKPDASLTLSSNVYLFDKDQWGQYCYNKYFYSMTNLTIHKDRGTTNAGLDDAKLKVNGIVNVTGQIYSTTSGGDIMGDGDGTITFSSLPSATNIVMCTGVSDNENVAVASANLHNEDDSYTKSVASTTFQNINGRWFTQAAATANKADHTYDFTYISSGAVSGSGGNNTTTDAVYSWDKTGLELRQKWFNVTADCNESGHYWWHGQGDQSGWFYNWTLNSDWHQFMPTATAGLYSGSNNTLYTKTSCTWEELGSTDVNCLYEIGGVKKALVDGQFVALEANNNDPAYHEAEDPTKYYICFEGCNWHAADKYTEAEKAYIIEPDTFVWYNNAWMSVNFKEPFAYTIDETNVPVYYEYVDGEWVLAEPYIRVVDGLEDRSYWFLDEAFKFASSVLRTAPTITILRDISGITTAVSYTGANKTCTLNLNGHTITGSVSGMITVNAAGCTFNIVDNTEQKLGKINLVFSENNARRRALYVQNGHAILNSGTIASTNTLPYHKTNSPKPYAEGVLVANGKQFTMNGGRIEVSSAYNPYGIEGASGTPTININGGTLETVAETNDSPYGIYAYGTINVAGGTINAIAKASTSAMGVYVIGSSSYQGTANISGGTILARATGSAQAVRCWGSATVTGDYSAETPDNTPKARYYAKMYITGGTITAECTTKTTAYGVLSYGTTEISGGTITATVQKSDQNTAYGVCTLGGTTTIKTGANITANAPTKAYGVYCSGANGDSNRGWPHLGNVNIQGGTITANTTNTTISYGLYVTGATWTINKSNSYSVFNGDYASAGTATVTGGTFYANAKSTDAGGILVDNTVTKNDASATPVCTINGGYYQTTGTGTLNGCAGTALPANFQINGGYYSHDGNLATYAVAPKQVVTLPKTDANYDPYYYKVAEAYTVNFMNGTEQLQSGYQQVGTTPVYEGATPTKASDTKSYIFDGWSTTDGGSLVNPMPNVTSAGATYYAHFAETTLKYIVTFDAKTNGGNEEAQVSYVTPEAAVGTLPTATKTGYTFNGWFTAASGGTQITTATVPTSDVTYYAQFTVNSHTLTWDLAGGKVSTAGKIGSTTWPAKNAIGTPSTSVAYGTILTTIPVVAKTGYTFNHWDPIPVSSMPDNDVTYTALWNPNTNTAYTVKHYLQNVDGTYPTTPTETQSLTGTTATSVTPAVKSYEGFISPAAQMVTIAADGSTVVKYQYARRHYTFTLDAATNGGTSDLPSIEVIHGATIGAVPPDAQKGCNDFTGWYTKAEGGVKITSSFVIEYDMKKLYAQFSDDIRVYPITYRSGEHGTGTVDPETKTCGEDATLSSSTFTRTGYTQTGWSTTDDGAKTHDFGDSYTANAALTLYPFWTINQYTISFNSNGGSEVASITQDYNTSVTSPVDPTKTGYTFNGWSPDVPSTMPAENTECVAQWTANNYTITYKDQGDAAFSGVHGDGYPTTHTYGTATALVNPTKTGYTFEGWYTLSDCASGLVTGLDATAYTANITLYAKWTANTYEVTLDPRSGSGGSTSVTMTFNSAEHAAITNPTRTGYSFHSWNTTTSSSTRKIVISSKGVLSENVAGYTGAGGVWIRTTMPTTLYARWTENTYAITFTHNGNGSISFNGSVVAAGSTAKVYYHTAKALVATPNTGYHFTGWTKSGTNASKVTIADMSAASTTIKATAKNATVTAGFAPDEYTITYKDQGDVVFSGVHGDGYPTTHTYGTATALVNPTKTGYTFGGWYDNADCMGTALTEVGATAYTADFTLYAKWTIIQYTISFNSNGGSDVASITQDYNSFVTAPADPTKTGYTFAGWSPEVPSMMPAENTECTAQWTANNYIITYKDQGDVVFSGVHGSGYPTTHTYGTATALVDPTKTGYTFAGWYDNADCTGTALTEVGATAYTADFTLYAKWTIKQYKVTFDSNGGSAVSTIEQDYNTSVSAPSDPTKTGYTFAGWSPEVPSVMPAEDTECVAQWTPNTNTPYVVKHYQQNLDGTYPDEPTETDNETGTTDTEVTPAVKDYTGFTAPSAQTVTISADGSRVVTYQYTRNSYNLTWNSNGGELSGSYTSGLVLFGTTITAPTANRANYDFDGWDEEPAATMPAEDKTYTAQWSLSAVTILWKSEDGSETLETDNLVLIGAAPSFDGTEPTKATTESYTYTFDGWATEANGEKVYEKDGLPEVTAATTYYAHFTATANVASVKVGSTTTYYTTIDAAFAYVNLQTANTELKLLRNTTATASLVFTPAAAMTCTLDLNNHTLSGALGRLIDVKLAKSTFIITDNSVAKGGKVDNNYNANERVYGVVLTAGTFKLQNGAIYSTNPHTYSSATANKSSAATAVYVASGQTFTMENGTVESASQYASYAIYMARGTSTVTIKNGLVKGRTTKSTTAAGIYNLGKGLTVNGGHIVAHAYTTTAYGIYLYGGHGTINGGTIEATNDTTSNKGTTTTYGIYVNYYNSTYKGVLTIPSTSTVNVFAKARTTTSYAIVVGGGSTGNTIAGGTFTAKTKTGKTAYCVNSSGNITISGGTFTAYAATTNAYGLYSARGTITVNGDPTFNVTAGSTTAYGALAYGTIGKKGTGKYSGTIEINGGTFNVTSTAETAWGAYAGLASRDLRSCSATNDTVPGLHYMPGILVVNDGTFNVKATTTGAFGIVVAKAKSESGTVGTTARIPLGTVTGGKFKVESMGDANATAYAMNSATTAARLVVQGGYYNTKRTDASEISNIEDKYTAPTKACNYHVLDLPEEELPYKYKVAEAYMLTWNLDGGKVTVAGSGAALDETGTLSTPWAVGDAITAPTVTKTDYTFNGWSPDVAATMPASDKTYTATWTFAETGDYLDIVDWTSNGDGTGTLTINANGWAASGWPNTINGTSYAKGDRAADRTLTIPYEGAAGTNLQIKVESGGSTTSLHNYKIPYINTTEGAGEEDIVYVNSGLTIDGDKTLAALYVRPEASVEVTKGTLTVGKLVLRTLPWQAAAISGNFTTTETWYTRIAPNKRTISGLGGEITYESASYYQFALPLDCTVPLSEIHVSHGANTPYGNTWLLKYYSEESRSTNGASGDNWVAVAMEEKEKETYHIQGGVGYEMSSNSNYYREFYFPVGAVNSASLGTKTTVSYHESPKGANHAGWNIICSPLMGTYENKFEDIETALKISELQTDGSYLQYAPDEIPAAIPFSYQAGKNGVLDFSGTELTEALSAPRRRMPATEEFVRLQWLRLFVKDDEGHGDETSILSHPTRYEEAYKTGIDVAKQSFTASRALIYSSHAYGEMAFAGVADSLLERGVALTIYSPSAQSLTISMRENNWLNRMEYVWLIDKETGIRTDLLTDEYSFYATEGTTAGRFFIEGVFAPKVTTDLQNDGMMNDESRMARKLLIDDKIYIEVNGRRYDATGKLVNGK